VRFLTSNDASEIGSAWKEGTFSSRLQNVNKVFNEFLTIVNEELNLMCMQSILKSRHLYRLHNFKPITQLQPKCRSHLLAVQLVHSIVSSATRCVLLRRIGYNAIEK
jgi:hypothetical protein